MTCATSAGSIARTRAASRSVARRRSVGSSLATAHSTRPNAGVRAWICSRSRTERSRGGSRFDRSARSGRCAAKKAPSAVLKKAPGLDLVDDPENKKYPMPLFTSEKYNCEVGRIRMDCALDNGLAFWVSGDQLLKGAALNAVQIAEELVK